MLYSLNYRNMSSEMPVRPATPIDGNLIKELDRYITIDELYDANPENNKLIVGTTELSAECLLNELYKMNDEKTMPYATQGCPAEIAPLMVDDKFNLPKLVNIMHDLSEEKDDPRDDSKLYISVYRFIIHLNQLSKDAPVAVKQDVIKVMSAAAVFIEKYGDKYQTTDPRLYKSTENIWEFIKANQISDSERTEKLKKILEQLKKKHAETMELLKKIAAFKPQDTQNLQERIDKLEALLKKSEETVTMLVVESPME